MRHIAIIPLLVLLFGSLVAADQATDDRIYDEVRLKISADRDIGQNNLQVTVEDAVAYSGYADQYLRRLAREGIIHAVKFGHVWLVHEESLQAYMDQARRLGSRDKRFGPREDV